MSRVTIESLSKRFKDKGTEIAAIDDLSIEISDGEMLVLVGPSGCGKTTTLRCVAGLELPTSGRITIGDDVVFDGDRRVDVPPEKRNLGMVFQSYALWPHKRVRDNIAYPLKARRMTAELRDGWVERAAQLVRVDGLLDRYPAQLSGGQQQRVAVARGFVARPGVVLYDEPLSNLDARLRDQVRGDLHQLHRELADTGIYVTHDQAEAFAIGDRVAVMREGRIAHLGTPREVYARPANDYVADFVGFLNRFTLQRREGTWATAAGELRGLVPDVPADVAAVHVRVRPANLEMLPSGAAPDDRICIHGLTVSDSFFTGQTLEVTATAADGTRYRASVPEDAMDAWSLKVGSPALMAVRPSAALLYDAADEGLLRDVSFRREIAPSASAAASSSRER